MGLQNGRVSLTRYRILDSGEIKLKNLSKEFRKFLAGNIKLRGLVQEERVGWIRPLNMIDHEILEEDYWDLSHCQVTNGFLLRMRIEKRKVPGELLQLLYREQLDISLKKQRKLNTVKRRELKEKVLQDLIKKVLPSISNVDIFWSNDGILTVYTTSSKILQQFETLFSDSILKSIGGTLVKLLPPYMAMTSKEWNSSHSILKAVRCYSELSFDSSDTVVGHS